MSKNSSDSPEKTWGTPESYWPFPRPVAEPTPEDRERFAALTVEQRWEWMIMMIRLLEQQFGHLIGGPPARPEPRT